MMTRGTPILGTPHVLVKIVTLMNYDEPWLLSILVIWGPAKSKGDLFPVPPVPYPCHFCHIAYMHVDSQYALEVLWGAQGCTCVIFFSMAV